MEHKKVGSSKIRTISYETPWFLHFKIRALKFTGV